MCRQRKKEKEKIKLFERGLQSIPVYSITIRKKYLLICRIMIKSKIKSKLVINLIKSHLTNPIANKIRFHKINNNRKRITNFKIINQWRHHKTHLLNTINIKISLNKFIIKNLKIHQIIKIPRVVLINQQINTSNNHNTNLKISKNQFKNS